MTQEIVSAVSSYVTVIIAIVLLYYCWRQYVIDHTRQSLFELRDSVFDLATRGQLDRQSREYRIVREMFNSWLRFTHRASLGRILILMITEKTISREPLQNYSLEVKRVINGIEDEAVREEIKHTLRQMHLVMSWHFVRISPITLIILPVLVLCVYSVRTLLDIREIFGHFLNGLAYSDATKAVPIKQPSEA